MSKGFIHTERLRLRFPVIEDADFIQREFPKWEIVKYLSNRVPWPYPDDGAKYFLENVILPGLESGEGYGFVIELKDGDDFTPIGMVSYEKADPAEGEGYVRGFWLGLDYHGNGYMTEASTVTNKWVFENTDTSAILTNNATENNASDKIKVKQGWESLGVKETKKYVGGFPYEHSWRLTRERWEKLNNA